MNELVLGENFFTLNNQDLSKARERLEEIIVLAKMSDYTVNCTTTKKEGKESEKVHEMIHFNKNGTSYFYLTFTYGLKNGEFKEFCINPMNEKIQNLIQEHELPKKFIYSKYFFATSSIEEMNLILDCAWHIVKKT